MESNTKKIDPDYADMRKQINNGKILPYNQYVRERTYAWVRNKAEKEDLRMLQATIEVTLEEKYHAHVQKQKS